MAGLRRYGEDEAADALADRSFALFQHSWSARRLCPENFNAETGEALDQPDTEGFYSWGALMALLGVARVMDIGPWRGWELVNDGATASLGPLESPIGQVVVAISDGILTLSRGGQRLLVTNIRGAISHIRFAENEISLTLPPIAPENAFLHFPGIESKHVRHLLLDGRPTAYTPIDAGITIAVQCASVRLQVELALAPAKRSFDLSGIVAPTGQPLWAKGL